MKENCMRLPGVEPGSISWKAIILTVGLQTRVMIFYIGYLLSSNPISN